MDAHSYYRGRYFRRYQKPDVKRAGSRQGSRPEAGAQVVHENTYQLHPNRRFQSYKAKQKAEAVVKQNLNSETEYSAQLAGTKAGIITQQVLKEVKLLDYDRYRFIVQTYIGQKRLQGLQIASRGLTDPATDSYAEYLFENKTLWCVVLIHGVYLD